MEKSRDRKLRYSIYVGPPLERLVAERTDDACPPTKIVNVAADRYLKSLEENKPRLSSAEWMLVFDALNGVIHDDTAESAGLAWMGVADAIRHDGLAEKWAVEGNALIEKLKALGYVEAVVLVDAAERFWRRFGNQAVTPQEALAALGLRPEPGP